MQGCQREFEGGVRVRICSLYGCAHRNSAFFTRWDGGLLVRCWIWRAWIRLGGWCYEWLKYDIDSLLLFGWDGTLTDNGAWK